MLSADLEDMNQPGGYNLDYVTAEVDERDEYSNDFDSGSDVKYRGTLNADEDRVQQVAPGVRANSTGAPGLIQEVLRVQSSSSGSARSATSPNSFATVSANDNQEVIFREVMT